MAPKGNNNYKFGGGNDTADYSVSEQSIQLVCDVVVKTGELGADIFKDF